MNEANLARIMCVSQAGLAKHGGELEAALRQLRESLSDLDEATSSTLLPIANEAEALRERMALAELEAGGYAELLTGAECTGDETLPQESEAPLPAAA